MAATRRFSVEVTTPASPDAVYRLLADAPSWAVWAGPLITRAAWEVEPGPGGVGGIRRLGRPPVMVREEIVAAEPSRVHGYRLLSGQPVRSYGVEVRITALGEPPRQAAGVLPPGPPGRGATTRIEWTGTVEVLVPGTGWLMERLLRRMLRGFARRLAAASESASGAQPEPRPL